jgi:RHS repeat-associated protein
MIAHLVRVWLTAVGILLWSVATSHTATAQTNPPTITISTPGTFSVGSIIYSSGANPLEIISFCVPSNRSVDSVKITLNGTNVTSQFNSDPGAGASCSGTELVDTAHVEWLSWGVNHLTAYACSKDQTFSDPQYCGSSGITLRLTLQEVTPKATAANGHVSQATSEQFQVHNLVATAQTFNMSVICSGSGVSGCSTSPSKITVPANGASPVTVNFTAGALNSTGTITLVAVDSATTSAADTGSVNFTAAWIIPEVISTAYTNFEDQDLSRCANNCFALRTTVSTVPYVSRDAANGVTLQYNSDQVAVRPVLYADVQVKSNPYTLQGFQFSAKYNSGTNGWLNIIFLNGDQTLNFAAVSDTNVYRMAGQFDASSFPTNHGQAVYPLRMQVITTYSDHADTLIDSTHHLALVNNNSSPVAKGWSIAGVSVDNWCVSGSNCQTYEMHVSGDGSVSLVGPVSCGSVDCWWYPVSTGVFAYLFYKSQPYAEYKFADSSDEVFSPAGYLTARVGLPTDTVRYGYDAQNRVITISDPYRMQPSPNNTMHTYWEINYGTNGISSIVEPDSAGHPGMGRTTTISVDANGLLRSWTDPDNVTSRFGYDSHNRLDTLYDRKANTTTFAYDSISWKLTRITSPAVPIDNSGTGSPTSATIVQALTPWQTIGVPDTSTSGTPATAVKVSTVIAADSSIGGKTTFTVDRWGQPLAVTTPLGLTTTLAYDLNGYDTLTTYPSGAADRYKYFGPFLVSSTPSGQNQTQYTYCAYAQLCTITVTGGPSITLSVNANGHTDAVSVAGSTWHFYGDSLGRDTLDVDAQHGSTRYRFDTRTGNLDSAIAWPSYRFVAATFDGHGRTRTVSVSTMNGPTVVTTTAYDSLNRVASSTDGLHSTPTRFTFDSLFNTAIRDPLGQPYHYAYNALGWDTTETDTASRTVRTTYSSFGTPTTHTNRRAQVVQTLYDSHGRDSIVTRPSSEADNVDHFRYPDIYTVVDSNSVVKDITYASQTTGRVDSTITTFLPNGNWFKRAYTFDALGRGVTVAITTSDSIAFNTRTTAWDQTTGLIDSLDITSASNRLVFGYDSLFRLTSITYPSSVVRNDSYFTSGQLASTAWSPLSLSRSYGYDSTGRVDEVDYNGMAKGDTSALLTYDILGELAQRQLIKWTDTATSCPGGQLQNGFGCRYGSSRSDSILQTVTYSYDAARNLDTVKVGSTDTIGTMVPGNRLTAWTGLTFAVDSDGNRTSTTVGSQTTTYTWGADGRLLSVTRGDTTRTYDYDPAGRLVQRKTNGSIDRYYLWDNRQILAILDGTAAHRIAEFVYFGGADQPLARITGATTADTVHYLAQDALGNVIAQFRGTTIEQSLSYDPWGVATLSSHPDSTQLRWKGLLYENGITSLYYVRARWYDPVTRRYVSPDPLGLAAGMNQYSYAGNDPINGSDPSGTCEISEVTIDDVADGGTICFGYVDNGFGFIIPYAYFEPTMPTVVTTALPGWGPSPGTGIYVTSGFLPNDPEIPMPELPFGGGGGGPPNDNTNTNTNSPPPSKYCSPQNLTDNVRAGGIAGAIGGGVGGAIIGATRGSRVGAWIGGTVAGLFGAETGPADIGVIAGGAEAGSFIGRILGGVNGAASGVAAGQAGATAGVGATLLQCAGFPGVRPTL